MPCPDHYFLNGLLPKFESNLDVSARKHAYAWLIRCDEPVSGDGHRVESGGELFNDGTTLCIGFH